MPGVNVDPIQAAIFEFGNLIPGMTLANNYTAVSNFILEAFGHESEMVDGFEAIGPTPIVCGKGIEEEQLSRLSSRQDFRGKISCQDSDLRDGPCFGKIIQQSKTIADDATILQMFASELRDRSDRDVSH